jgi:tetratricopeptide (TPR) repeat protein
LLDKGEPQEALKVLQRSKTDFRYNTAASLQMAVAESRVYQKMGQPDKAQTAMANAERLASQMDSQPSPALAVEMAQAHLKLGQKDKACQLLSEVIKNDHENTQLSNEVAAIFEAEQLADVGQALIKAARQEVIDINNQGVMLAKQGDFQQGAKLLRTALTKLPTNEVMILNLCGLLIAQMSKDGYDGTLAAEARDWLARVRDINPASKKFYSYSLALARLQRA